MNGEEQQTLEQEIRLAECGERPTVCYRLWCRPLTEAELGEAGAEGLREVFSLSCETAEERATASDLTTDRHTAEQVLRLLVDGEVTPLGFYEVMEEILAWLVPC